MDTSRKRSKQEMIREILDGCWASCLAPDPDSKKPFVANAIIANPLSIAHIHCAQALGIPVHIVSTMPWSPTRAFPHPLTKVQSKDSDFKLASYLSYKTIQMSAWNRYIFSFVVFDRSLTLESKALAALCRCGDVRSICKKCQCRKLHFLWKRFVSLTLIVGLQLCFQNQKTGENTLVSWSATV